MLELVNVKSLDSNNSVFGYCIRVYPNSSPTQILKYSAQAWVHESSSSSRVKLGNLSQDRILDSSSCTQIFLYISLTWGTSKKKSTPTKLDPGRESLPKSSIRLAKFILIALLNTVYYPVYFSIRLFYTVLDFFEEKCFKINK